MAAAEQFIGKMCPTTFELDAGERAWFLSRGLATPRRCLRYRQEAKRQRACLAVTCRR
jgi:hypothetical protein